MTFYASIPKWVFGILNHLVQILQLSMNFDGLIAIKKKKKMFYVYRRRAPGSLNDSKSDDFHFQSHLITISSVCIMQCIGLLRSHNCDYLHFAKKTTAIEKIISRKMSTIAHFVQCVSIIHTGVCDCTTDAAEFQLKFDSIVTDGLHSCHDASNWPGPIKTIKATA